MAHVFIIAGVLAVHLLLLAIFVYFQNAIVRVFDWFCLDRIPPPPEGELTTDMLRKLWSAPGDGAECVLFDDEGGWRLAACNRRAGDH